MQQSKSLWKGHAVICALQVITVKAKYVVDNQTGMPIEIKQKGTPDLPPDFISEDNQCARRLAINERQATACSGHSSHRQIALSPVFPYAEPAHVTRWP